MTQGLKLEISPLRQELTLPAFLLSGVNPAGQVEASDEEGGIILVVWLFSGIGVVLLKP